MKTAIMQPYFLPYIGYFQLISSVDQFIVYDNIKYTKKGWISRNRYLLNGCDAVFSLQLKKASDTLFVSQRELSDAFNRSKLLNQFKGAYYGAPYFSEIYPLLELIINFQDDNLLRFIFFSICQLCKYLHITTELRLSSEININHQLKGQEKVLALCKAVKACTYINSSSGKHLYDRDIFQSEGISLKFIKSTNFEYKQFSDHFVPWLSIIDLLMFNSADTALIYLQNYYEVA